MDIINMNFNNYKQVEVKEDLNLEIKELVSIIKVQILEDIIALIKIIIIPIKIHIKIKNIKNGNKIDTKIK